MFFKSDEFKSLKKQIGRHKVQTSSEYLISNEGDATRFRGNAKAILYPETASDVQRIVEYAIENKKAIVPRGAGSGLSGGAVPSDGCLVCSFEQMKKILRLDIARYQIEVEPGTITEEIQTMVKQAKLFYPPDPSSYKISTIGGNVAENAGGLRCFKYGVTSHYVVALEYVDANGKLCTTGNYNLRPQLPDLTSLLVGSEGTLGIITKIMLRLIPLPQQTSTISAFFKQPDQAFEAVEEILSSGFVPSVMEFIDKLALTSAAQYAKIDYPEDAGAMLLLEVDGNPEEVSESTPEIENILRNYAQDVEIALKEEHRQKLWGLRRAISPSLIKHATGKIHEDIAVPRGKLQEMLVAMNEISRTRKLSMAIYGHIGDGNLHVVIFYDMDKSSSQATAEKFAQDVFTAAINFGGTITGEHGVGLAKREFLPKQIGNPKMKMLRQIKRTLDPHNVFNPGKIFIN